VNRLDFSTSTLESVASPNGSGHAVNRAYIDTIAKTPVRLCATGNVAGTYANGSSGVGATLTVTATGALSVDGTAVSAGDRLLLPLQTTGAQAGIYTVTNAGSVGVSPVLTRATDFDVASEMTAGVAVVVQEGSVYAGSCWYLSTTVATVGTSAVSFALDRLRPITFGSGLGAPILSIYTDATLSTKALDMLVTGGGLQIGSSSQKLALWGKTPIVQPASANQAAVGTTAPAGGTGTAAGGWDTAGHRDTAIATINSCVTLVNQLRSDLVSAGVIKGSA
jgi:hypothetical protein